MSTHSTPVVPVVLTPHPDADSLSIVMVDDKTVCVRTQDWEGVDRGVHVPPDYVVPDTEQFAFLKGKRRIKTAKLRGIMSYGLLIPAPEGAEIGDNVMDQLGIQRYVPALSAELKQGQYVNDPPEPGPKYDLENFHKYANKVFGRPFEPMVFVFTEKLHGTNARYTFQDGKMFCGSRSFYREKDDSCIYWKALEENPWIENFCRKHPGVVLYGEIYGWVQDLRYGANPGEISFRAFDVYDGEEFWSYFQLTMQLDQAAPHHISPPWNRWVPTIYQSFIDSLDELKRLVESHTDGPSLIAPHIREGIVIRPYFEPTGNERYGRRVLKSVSDEYLAK